VAYENTHHARRVAHVHAARESAIAAENNSGAVGDDHRVFVGAKLVCGQRQVDADDVALLRRPAPSGRCPQGGIKPRCLPGPCFSCLRYCAARYCAVWCLLSISALCTAGLAPNSCLDIVTMRLACWPLCQGSFRQAAVVQRRRFSCSRAHQFVYLSGEALLVPRMATHCEASGSDVIAMPFKTPLHTLAPCKLSAARVEAGGHRPACPVTPTLKLLPVSA